MNCFVSFELMRKQGGLWPALFPGLPNDVAKTTNDYDQ